MDEPDPYPFSALTLRSRATATCIIACTPRSGSWLMAEALHNTHLVGQPEEYFRPDHTPMWSRRWGVRLTSPYETYMEAAMAFSTTPNGVFSVKLHWYQFTWLLEQLRAFEGNDGALEDSGLMARTFPNPHYLFMTRRDKARQAISYYRAATSNVWFVLGDKERSDDEDVEPDFQSIRSLEHVVEQHEAAWRTYFQEGRIEPLEVVYEDFEANYEDTVAAVLRELDITPPPTFIVHPPGLRKQADARSEEILARYLEIRPSLPPNDPAPARLTHRDPGPGALVT